MSSYPRIFISFLILLSSFLKFSNLQEVRSFWVISDPHLDFKYAVGADPDFCQLEIMCCRHFHNNQTRRCQSFGEREPKPLGSYCDTPVATIEAGFQFLIEYSNRMVPKPDFLLLGGDYADHGADLHTEADILDNVRFISEQAMKAAMSISSDFKVFPALGNHDSFPFDQLKLPPNTFVERIASEIWEKLPGMSTTANDTSGTLRHGAFYSKKLRIGIQLIVLNTQWTSGINLWTYVSEKDHAGMLQWFENELEDSKKNGDQVLILGHICPHTDRFRWIPEKAYQFLNILEKYRDIVAGMICGHNHVDRFRVFVDRSTGETPWISMFIGGILTPTPERNVAMRLYYYQPSPFKLLDFTEFYGDIGEANIIGNLKFKKLYSFRETYGVSDLTAQSLFRLHQEFKRNDTLFEKYMLYERAGYKPRQCTDINCRNFYINEILLKNDN